MGEEQPASSRDQVTQERAFLIDQELRVSVITHRDREVNPGRPRDQVPTEDERASGGRDLNQELTWGVTVARVEAITLT